MLKILTVFITCMTLFSTSTSKNFSSAIIHNDDAKLYEVFNPKDSESTYTTSEESNIIDDYEVFNYQNNKISISKDELYLMAQVVFAESRAEPFTGKVAVASVILNRLVSDSFPDTIEGVIKQKAAFSCIIDNEISVIPDEPCFEAVYAALSGEDPTNFSLFYYNPQIATCTWMKNIEKSNVTQIGNHVFFVVN